MRKKLTNWDMYKLRVGVGERGGALRRVVEPRPIFGCLLEKTAVGVERGAQCEMAARARANPP